MKYELPAISDDTLFEELIRDLMNTTVVGNPYQLYGVKGQRQFGIDMYCQEERCAVQCKAKSINRSDRKIIYELKNGINSSVESIRSNELAIKKLVFATSFRNDTALQNLCYSLSDKLDYKVEFLDWNRIAPMILDNSELLLKYFPELDFTEYFQKVKQSEIEIRKKVQMIDIDIEYSYIPRTFVSIKNNAGNYNESSDLRLSLESILDRSARTVIVSMGGLGKSIELKNLGKIYCEKSSSLIPIFIRLKDFDGSIEKLISHKLEDWIHIDPSKLLILCDGLDEVITDEFPKALVALSNFSKSKPNAKIVLSCRTNFLDSLAFDKKESAFANFDFYLLRNLSENDIQNYVNSHLKTKTSSFLRMVEKRGMKDWLKNPFNLTVLVDIYLKNGEDKIPSSKNGLFQFLIDKKIEKDLSKYSENGSGILYRKEEIQIALEKIALSMEGMGKNQIFFSDLLSLIDNDYKLMELIKHSFLFNRNAAKPEIFEFENSSTQEYLAAKILSRQSFETANKFLFHSPDFFKIKDTWINTLSYLLDLLPKESEFGSQLLSKVVASDPTALIRIESDKIDKVTRGKLFFDIIENSWSDKRISLYSQNFYSEELVRFSGQGKRVIQRIISEIELPKSEETLYDALSLLLALDNISDFEDKVFSLLMNIINTPHKNIHLMCDVLRCMAKYKLNTSVVTGLVINSEYYKSNALLRESVYRFLIDTNQSEEYLDYFLEGRKLLGSNGENSSSINIGEASVLLEGLEKATCLHSVKKILSAIIDYPETKEMYNESILSETLIQNISNAYFKEDSIFDDVLCLVSVYAKSYQNNEIAKLKKFFVNTASVPRAFKHYIDEFSNLTPSEEKLDGMIADETCVDYLIGQVKSGFIPKAKLGRFLNHLGMALADLGSVHDYAYRRINEEFSNEFTYNVSDYKIKESDRVKSKLDYLFDKRRYFIQLKKYFNRIGREEINKKNLMDWWLSQRDELGQRIDRDLVFSTLHEKCEKRAVTYDVIYKELYPSKNWEWYKLTKLMDIVNHQGIDKIGDRELNFILKWCLKSLKNVDFSLTYYMKGKRLWVNNAAIYIARFWAKMNFEASKDQVSEFLMTISWYHGQEPEILSKILNFVGEDLIAKKVIENIRKGIIKEEVLITHLRLCRSLKLTEALPYLYNIFLNKSVSGFTRNKAIKYYIQLGGDSNELEQLVNEIDFSKNSSEWQYTVIDELISNKSKILEERFQVLMDNIDLDVEFQLASASYLIKMGNISGLLKYQKWIKDNKINPPRRIDSRTIVQLPLNASVDILITMLLEVHEIKLEKNKFSDSKSMVKECLFELALHSDYGFTYVVEKLNEFIMLNKLKYPDVSESYHWIRWIEKRHYHNKSDKWNIVEIRNANSILV